jgi:tetratricopeptide (TPR) repeat protein
MQIIHKIDDFFFTIFPETTEGDNTIITNILQKYYSYGSIVPTIKIEKNLVYVNLDADSIFVQENEFKKAVKYCEQGKYAEAKPILKNLISQNPSHSEYHRVLGQIYSDEGNQDEAINSLIDALRWDATNGWALLMMGNIFARFKADVPTAMKYYDQAILHNQADHFSLSNI